MAQLDGMTLFAPGGPPASGGAYRLTGTPRADAAKDLGDGWTVEIRQGGGYVVARRAAAPGGYEDARDGSFRAAQQGLDLFAITRVADLGIVEAKNDHLAWWVEPAGAVLRVTAVVTLTATVGASAAVTPAAGSPGLTPPPVPGVWHESLRYFRLAQVTDDLFDAYRNLYLALESVLDRVAPQRTRPPAGGPPRPDEKEGEWLLRALGEAGRLVNLAAFVPAGTPDPVRALFDDLYVGVRTALFHAKTSRHFLLPHDAAGRQAVLGAVERLGRLYLAIADRALGLPAPLGVITYEGFAEMARAWEPGFRVHATDDPAVPAGDPKVLNPSGGRVVTLTTRPAPELDAPHLKSFLGAAGADQLGGLTGVRRVTATLGDTPVAHGVVDGALTVEGVARLEAHVGIRLRNSRMPKTLFGS